MIEQWKPIEGYEGLYEISNMGNVKSLPKCRGRYEGGEKILKQHRSEQGYMKVTLCKDSKVKSFRVHRLVAEAFIPNQENKVQINHIDGNKCNNNINNLEWNTGSENIKHAYDNKLKRAFWLNKKSVKHPNSKKVLQYDKNMKFIKVWDSMSDIEREMSIFVDSVSKCCKGSYKTAGGYIWRYKEDKQC